jgi:anti-anti-sigma regulatory factor
MLDVAIRRSAAAGTVCRLDGELVSSATPVIRALRGRLVNARTLLVDLRGIVRFDRPGLGALIGVLRGAHPDADRVRLRAELPALVRLLRAEGLDRLFPLVDPDDPSPAGAAGAAA